MSFSTGPTGGSHMPPSRRGPDPQTLGKLKNLEETVSRLRLANQAMWELLKGKLGITDDELAAKMEEVDVRDGIGNGKLNDTGLKCPQCGRVTNARHSKCLYCGLVFKRTTMF